MKTTPDVRAIAIRAIRAQLGITRPALARLLEVSTSSVKSWELGFRSIDARTFAAIEHLVCRSAQTPLIKDALKHADERIRQMRNRN